MPIVAKIKNALRRHEGPLTRELVQVPGEFGLGKVPSNLKPNDVTNLVCGFCSVGCSLNAHLRNGQAINLSPDSNYPVNLGMACPKGWEALTPLAAADRATTPLLKNGQGRFEPVDWDTAMQVFTVRFKAIQDKHGKDSVAWIGTGQIASEELAFLGALGKFGMNIVHGDSNTRQCMATSVAAYKQSFGFDAPPYTYKDFEESDVLIFFGSNICIAHPILWQRVLRNKNNPAIIVVDPRKTETAMAATQHYAIEPKSDLILLYGLANILIEKGWVDTAFIEKHTSEFDAFKAHVADFKPERVAADCGLSIEQLHYFAETIHHGKKVSFWWTMGVNQGHEATRTAQGIINLALMTGNIGRPGTGANSITGQCNAMGSRLFSNTSSLFCGRDFTKEGHRHEVADALKIDVRDIPVENSFAYDQIVAAIDAGKIKGLWIIGTNSSHSWVQNAEFSRILSKLDFLVVQDMFHLTETAQRADLVLPAAGWGEKEGTFINSERRIGLLKKISKAPGQALSDFSIFKLIAHYWGCSHLFQEWTSPEAVFQILKRLSRNQPCDITGIRDYRMIDESGGIQWPLPEGSSEPEKERRLFADGWFFHPNGKAKLVFDVPRQMPGAPDEKYPFMLLTGRGSSAQWHTQTRTGKSMVLQKLHRQGLCLEINPKDARRLRIADGETAVVRSIQGQFEAKIAVTNTVSKGQLFAPMHYPEVNSVVPPVFDPHSRQPSFKAVAVCIERVTKK